MHLFSRDRFNYYILSSVNTSRAHYLSSFRLSSKVIIEAHQRQIVNRGTTCTVTGVRHYSSGNSRVNVSIILGAHSCIYVRHRKLMVFWYDRLRKLGEGHAHLWG